MRKDGTGEEREIEGKREGADRKMEKDRGERTTKKGAGIGERERNKRERDDIERENE